MTASNVVRAILYPLTESRVLVPLIVFALLIALATAGGLLGRLLYVLTTLAVFRYLTVLVEARANARTPATPDTEMFSLLSHYWSLMPMLLAIGFVLLWLGVKDDVGFGGGIVILVIASVVMPASMAVLAITHSAFQSINPVALVQLWARCGKTLWIASSYIVIAGTLLLLSGDLPQMLANIAQLALMFSVAALIGSLIHPYEVIQDISIPESTEASSDVEKAVLARARNRELSHAYGFISRGNSDGGFNHVFESIRSDSQPNTAWEWYFDGMLRWDSQKPALFFAQHYVHDLLAHGDTVKALKLILRCRLLNDQWVPHRDDLPAAISAAEKSGNIGLAVVLKRV